MSQRKERNAFLAIVGSLAWPLLIGMAVSSILYALIFRGPLNLPFMHRYFAGHWVLFAETYLFFVGLAALVLKLLDVLGQYVALQIVSLGDPPGQPEASRNTEPLLQRLSQLPGPARQSYLGRRLWDALQFVQRKGSAEGLDGELKYLSDMDAARQQESYGLVRIVIWATPMLGFLGTVIGITQALGDLDPKLLATDIQAAMQGLLSGLYVAFDTTALALTLSMILMFIQFLIDRMETQLLSLVDLRCSELLAGRFVEADGPSDPQVAAVERMSRGVIRATETLVERQTHVWRATIDAAHEHWSRVVPAAGEQVQTAVAAALDQALGRFTAAVAQIEREATEQAQARWERWQSALAENARHLQAQQHEMSKQSEIMLQVVQATGEVLTLERALNDNLQALAGAKNFEDLVMSLTAAIHLLTARLGTSAASTSHVDLVEPRAKGRAA